MLSPLVCGSFSSQEDEDDINELLGECNSTPKRSKKTSYSCSSRETKNPYANRGLDKFSALLAELEDKKQKIYTQKGSKDISFVHFVYSNSNDCKPIVVKARDRKLPNNGTNHVGNVKEKQMSHVNSLQSQEKRTIEATNVVNQEVRQQEQKKDDASSQIRPAKKSVKWSLNLQDLRQPYWYMPVMMVLILMFLAMFGRSFAIFCTSLGWYLVPAIQRRSSSSEEVTKKSTRKDYVRRLSEKNMVKNDKVVSSPRSSAGSSSPKSVLN